MLLSHKSNVGAPALEGDGRGNDVTIPEHLQGGDMSIQEHLADIDFRTREARQLASKEDFVKWYNELQDKQAIEYDGRVQAQIEVLSAVLWYLLPKQDYKKLMKR